MLAITGLRKSFFDPGRGLVAAVDGLDLDIPEGVTAVIGGNGAGKTTLLRLIATLLTPDAGRIVFDGVDAVADGTGLRRRLGHLAAGTRLPARLTVREVLSFHAGLLDLADPAARIAHLAERFGLERFLDQRCQGLSTGQGQRAALARTLLGDPDLLILDEPTTGLDVVAAHALCSAVSAERRPGRVVLIATHVMAEAEAVADRALILRDGRIAAHGTLAEVAADKPFARAVQELVL